MAFVDRAYDRETSGPGPWDQVQPPRVDPELGTNREDYFSRPNGLAMPVNQRSASKWSGHTLFVPNANDANAPGSVVPSQKGRVSVTLLVPSTAAAAVWLSHDIAPLLQASPVGFYLAVGAAITLYTEGAIYALSATAGTDSLLSVATTYNGL